MSQAAWAESQVRSLDFEGESAVPERVLRSSMLTRERSWLRFWRPRPTWTEGRLLEDRERLERTYRNHGYYEARIEFEIEEHDDGESADITVHIDEGEPVRLSSIRVEIDGFGLASTGEGSAAEGGGAASEAAAQGGGAASEGAAAAPPISEATLVAELPIAVGDVFTVDLYRRARASVLLQLANVGRPTARLTGGAEVVVAGGIAHIDWRVAVGPPVTFGPVLIEGAGRVSEHVVRREIMVTEGATYTADALERTRNRLLRLQLFRYVSVQPDKKGTTTPRPEAPSDATPEPKKKTTTTEGDAPEPATTSTPEGDAPEPATTTTPDDDPPAPDAPLVWPVVVQLEERAPRSISLGAGWASGLGPRGSGRWTHRNFFGGARQFVVAGSGSPLEQTANMQLLQPYVFDTQATLTVDTGWRRRHRSSYDTNTVDFAIGPRRSVGEHWVLEGFYRFGWTDIRNVSDPTNEVLRAQRGSGLLSGFGTRARRAHLDDPTNPRWGTWLQLGIATNLEALGSDFDWMRYDGEVRGYVPLGWTVAAFRARYQAIQPLGSTSADEVPLGERLFLGGPSTGRGFPFEELGPLDADGEPVGGVASLLVSAEWRIPVWGPLTVVGFVDAGQVSLSPFGFDPAQIGVGTGAGLAFSTPIGPLALYVGYPVRPLQSTQKVRVALSIGHAF